MLRISRKKDRDKYEGVICSSSMEVPEIPLSYSLTGVRKIVMPKAFMIPAMVSMAIWIIRVLREWFIVLIVSSFHKTDNSF